MKATLLIAAAIAAIVSAKEETEESYPNGRDSCIPNVGPCIYPSQPLSERITCQCPDGFTLVGSLKNREDKHPTWTCKKFQKNCDILCPSGYVGFCESNNKCKVKCDIPKAFFTENGIYSHLIGGSDHLYLNKDEQGWHVLEEYAHQVDQEWGACDYCPNGRAVCLRRVPLIYYQRDC